MPQIPTIIVLGILFATIGFLLFHTSRTLNRRRTEEPSGASVGRKPHVGDPAALPQETSIWQVEMHEFVRETKAELDSKMRALQQITAEADRAAARLEVALQNRPLASTSEASSLQTPTISRSSRPVSNLSSLPSSEPKRRQEQQGIDLSNLPSNQAESLSPSGVPRTAHSSAQSKKEEIEMYADYGMEPAEIARRVGHPIGEVELILSLRKAGR